MRARSFAIAAVPVAVALLLVWRGGGGEPTPDPDVGDVAVVHSPEQVATTLREASAAGRVGRVAYVPEGGAAEPARHRSLRGLRPEEQRRLLRDLEWMLQRQRVALATPVADGVSAVEREVRIASLQKALALEEAAVRRIEAGEAFVAPDLVPDLRSDDECYYWNIRRRTEPEGGVVVYVPIPLQHAPDVVATLARAEAARGAAQADDAHAWNSLDFAERRRLVDEAGGARRRHAEIEQELDALAADSATAERRRALQHEAEQLIPVISRAPRQVDPTTLEFVRR